MNFIVNTLVLFLSITLWGFILDKNTQAPSKAWNYYLSTYDAQTQGVIVKSDTRSKRHGRAYSIEYEYNINEQVYYSNSINSYANYSNTTAKTVKKYPVGKKVLVYYDKANPESAILELTMLDWWVWLQIIAAVILGIVTMTMFSPEKS